MKNKDLDFDAGLNLVPESPGVYIMKDASDSVIYVGKAVNLRSRLRTYFTSNPKGTPKVLAMISNISDFEYIICSNETEAFILECNLIKEYKPKYNILLTDDREYPYIKITLNEDFPKVSKAYRIEKDIDEGVRYYGPYLNGPLNRSLEILKSYYPVRNCNLRLPECVGKYRPCLNYHIGKCQAPCAGYVTKEEYGKNIKGIIRFLEGKYDGILKDLRKSMEDAAVEMKYEKAAQYRDKISSLYALMEKQKVAQIGSKDLDVIGIETGEAESCIMKLEIRQGRLTGNSVFFASGMDEYTDENIISAIMQHYAMTPFIPKEILISLDEINLHILRGAISDLRGVKTVIREPKRGRGKELLKMAEKNAATALRRRTMFAGKFSFAAEETLNHLSVILFQVPGLIKRIEGYDISNYKDSDIAASMVVFQNAKPLKSAYRLFRIKGQEGQDDYSSLDQALRRRFGRKEDRDFGDLPRLILVDGGKGHVGVAQKVLEDFNLSDKIAVLGMVKDMRHRTRGLVTKDGYEIRLTGDENTVSEFVSESELDYELDYGLNYKLDYELELEDRKNLLRLVAGIQDEAHRFALKYSGKLSKKRQIRFALEDIKGVGPERRKSLMKEFGSIRAIRDASPERISQTPGISLTVAEEIHKYFHGDKGEQSERGK